MNEYSISYKISAGLIRIPIAFLIIFFLVYLFAPLEPSLKLVASLLAGGAVSAYLAYSMVSKHQRTKGKVITLNSLGITFHEQNSTYQWAQIKKLSLAPIIQTQYKHVKRTLVIAQLHSQTDQEVFVSRSNFMTTGNKGEQNIGIVYGPFDTDTFIQKVNEFSQNSVPVEVEKGSLF